jgi:hypothetical protein
MKNHYKNALLQNHCNIITGLFIVLQINVNETKKVFLVFILKYDNGLKI